MILRITIHDAPQGKGRPRFARASGRTFTPARTRAWEARAATAVADALPPGWTPPRLAKLVVDAVFARPERLVCRHKRTCRCEADGLLGRLPHVVAPDADNVLKAVCDALEKGGAVSNDAVIWSATVRKWYASPNEAPAVYVVLEAP